MAKKPATPDKKSTLKIKPVPTTKLPQKSKTKNKESITSELTYPNLVDDAREVIRTLLFREKLLPASKGRWFMMRIMLTALWITGSTAL